MNFHLCSFTRQLLYNVVKKKKCERFVLSGIQIQRDRTLNLIITFTSHILSILVVPLSLLWYCCFPTKMTCQLEDQPQWGCKPMKIRPCSTCRAHTHKREASGAGLLPQVYSTGYKGLNWCLYDIMWVNSFRVPIKSVLPRRGFHFHWLRPPTTHSIPASLFLQGRILFL